VVATFAGRDYIWVMREKDVIETLGPQDKIVEPTERMRSRAWLCSTCGDTTVTAEPQPPPAPCPKCRGVFFETIEANG
jgi:rubrerythrin